jgi:hypothetical protein
MATRPSANSIAKLASEVAKKELDNGASSETDKDLLNAIASVASLLEQKAGGNLEIDSLLKDVKNLIAKHSEN